MLGAVCAVGVWGQDPPGTVQLHPWESSGFDQGEGSAGSPVPQAAVSRSAGAEWVSLGLNVPPLALGPGRGVPVGWGHCLVAAEEQDQSLPLCSPVAGSAGVSEPFVGPEETVVGFGLRVLAVGALLALQ